MKPTLWRTSRVLANRSRLQLLYYVSRHPHETVSEIAGGMGWTLAKASLHLRALNARGVLQSIRHGRYVRYVMRPDPSVPMTNDIVSALEKSLKKGDKKEGDGLFQVLTAFTHPRRLAILHVIRSRAGLTFEQLAKLTGIPRTSLNRHLTKLIRRGFVRQAGEGYLLANHETPLGATLLKMC